MTHNKGKRYINCPECKRKRYCSFSSLPDDHRKIICSKGHEWVVKLSTLERIYNISKEQILARLPELFNRDDMFYKALRDKK